MLARVILLVVVIWIMVGGLFGCSVISNRLYAREQHFKAKKAKIWVVAGLFFGLGLLASLRFGLQIMSTDLLIMGLAQQFAVAIFLIIGLGIEAMVATHYDPNHGM